MDLSLPRFLQHWVGWWVCSCVAVSVYGCVCCINTQILPQWCVCVFCVMTQIPQSPPLSSPKVWLSSSPFPILCYQNPNILLGAVFPSFHPPPPQHQGPYAQGTEPGAGPQAPIQEPGGGSQSWASQRRPGSALSWKTFWLFVYIRGAPLPGNMAVTGAADSDPAAPSAPSAALEDTYHLRVVVAVGNVAFLKERA